MITSKVAHMIILAKNNKPVKLSRLGANDFDDLLNYFQNLSAITKNRFGPHPFDKQSVTKFYQNSAEHKGYIARDLETSAVIAYFIIKLGVLEHDSIRLESYGVKPCTHTDCTFAPSVADSWQGNNIGSSFFQYLLPALKDGGMNRIILWGGVQAHNYTAINYYKKIGFRTLGQFHHNGDNYDMAFDIHEVKSIPAISVSE